MVLRKLVMLFAVLAVAAVTFAQEEEADVVASGLNNPRNIFVAEDGTVYIAEAGSGGTDAAEGPFGPLTVGLTSQFSVVSPEGEQSVLLGELVSMDPGFGLVGAMDIHVTDESYWLVLGMGPSDEPYEDAVYEAVVEINRETMEVGQAIDLRAFEVENNPDDGFDVASNPSELAVAEDGTQYIADASANTVLKWTAEDGLSLFAAWAATDDQPSAVPTSVDVGPDGNVYVGFLSGFPFPTEGAHIEVYSPEGELVSTYEGLTMVTDVVVTEDGTIYAVEMAGGFGENGYIPDSGRIVTVSEDGLEVVAEGLNFPYGMAFDADGNILVTVNSAFVEPDSGEVIRIALEM